MADSTRSTTSFATSTPTADQAHQVFRKNLSSLIKDIVPELDLCDGLYSASVIGDEEYSLAMDDKKKDVEKARKLLYKTLQNIKSDYQHFETFCDLLKKSELDVHKKWGDKLKSEVQNESANGKENKSFKILSDQLSVIKRGLLQSDENVDGKIEIMKEFIITFIKHSLDAGDCYEKLRHQLDVLCYRDMSVHASLIDWAFEELTQLHSKYNQDEREASSIDSLSPPDTMNQKDSFSREHVSACLLLCNTVACDRSRYERFLSSHSHEFDEVSFSHSTDEDNKLDPYIIAKVGTKSELYVAFRGEQKFYVWQEKYHTFSEGISSQLNRIPIRFFIEQIRNGNKIFLTGFSMGGLLALSVYASLWKDSCLSKNTLLQSVVCITFGAPLVPLEELEQALKSVPDLKENSCLFIMEDDIIPRLLQFLEVRPNKKGQFNAYGLIFDQLANYYRQKTVLGNESISDIADLKRIIQEKQLAMSVDTKVFGKCHYIYTDLSSVSISILSAGAVLERLKFPDVSELEQIAKDRDIMTQHTLTKYEGSLIKAKYFQSSTDTGKSTLFDDVAVLKPDLSAITFYRHGDEVALVLQGENLWFCSKIKITSKSGSREINTAGTDAAGRSIHFNYVPKDSSDLIITGTNKAEVVDVICYSHFAKSLRKRLTVEWKGEYRATVRQRQVAKLTPHQVIIISFLSALLEVMENNYSSSRRYKAIHKFLEEAGRIVPLESIFYAIAFATSDESAFKYSSAFVSADVTIPPSHILSQSLGLACTRMCGFTTSFFQQIHEQVLFHHMSRNGPYPSPVDISVNVSDDNITVSVHPVNSHSANSDASFSFQLPQNQKIEKNKSIISSLQRCKDKVDMLIRRRHLSRLLCDVNIDVLYSTKFRDSSSNKLLSPIAVLKKGREELRKLQEEANEEISQLFQLSETEDMKDSHNEKMITTLNRIFTDDLSMCAYALGAFMQQQITVPLVDSTSSDTARILQTTACPPAVGVWALFCLKMIDFQKMTRAKKGKALVVMVEKYIKGMFEEGGGQQQQANLFPEQLYAGKLQFLLQCLVSSVSCNTSYISYSLERQLADLCEKCDITPTTRVQVLVKNWNVHFKKNLLLYVMPQFRSIVARWILWCLSIHHLREELASHTAVGIIGLSNSGKSCLVKSLFNKKVISGTTTMQRTTVPFLYNLEGLVDGLDVIDFPGIDDKDENVVKISNILLHISQLVILVVEYKRCNTKPVNIWVKALKEVGVPVLICLTHADKLYASTCLDENGDPKCTNEESKRLINQQLEKICEDLEQPPSWKVGFFYFSLDPDSKLNTASGIKCLEDVGILSSIDAGMWIENELRNYMKQPDIADRLKTFLLDIKKSHQLEDSDAPPLVRGLDVIKEASFDVTQAGDTFTLDEYGLQITFPPNSIRKTSQCLVKVISSGHYQLPEGTELVSSLYWVYFPVSILKPVDVEIQHCYPPSLLEKSSTLRFIKGKSDQSLPYKFSMLQKASFSCHTRRGLLSLDSFCILGIVCSQSLGSCQSPQIHSSILCVAKIYSKCEDNGSCLFEIVFIKDLVSIHTTVNTKYKENEWSWYSDYPFEFSSDSLSLSVVQNADLENWHCVERSSGKIITHSEMSSCSPKDYPQYSLKFEWSKCKPAVSISCPIRVTMGEYESFQLNLSLPFTVQGSPELEDSRLKNQEYNFDGDEMKPHEAVKVLQDAGFSFVSSYQSLMVQLEIETEVKKKLLSEVVTTQNHMMLVESAIDWWISNVKGISWKRLIDIVAKVEKSTSEKMADILK